MNYRHINQIFLRTVKLNLEIRRTVETKIKSTMIKLEGGSKEAIKIIGKSFITNNYYNKNKLLFNINSLLDSKDTKIDSLFKMSWKTRIIQLSDKQAILFKVKQERAQKESLH